MSLFHKGQLITYVDPENNLTTVILQNDPDTEAPDPVDRQANFSLWTTTALGVILTDPRLNVTHASIAGGPPYWVQFDGEDTH